MRWAGLFPEGGHTQADRVNLGLQFAAMAVCVTCGAGNREGRRFCAQCGGALAIECRSCGTSNEPDEHFCGECGAALASRRAEV